MRNSLEKPTDNDLKRETSIDHKRLQTRNESESNGNMPKQIAFNFCWSFFSFTVPVIYRIYANCARWNLCEMLKWAFGKVSGLNSPDIDGYSVLASSGSNNQAE